ncbi:MAG: N-acetyl-gamma-glutamyl-phosphate reductase [Saprospiraceae bacterium]|jgi:N-acetyl-gamma-glutamyl-phosphate reductase
MNYKIGIIGGGGYTAGELLRLLVHHPQVTIDFVWSNSQNGKQISAVHQDLVGDINLTFTNKMKLDVDVIFICSGHGFSKTFLTENEIPENIIIIDLSRDFRLKEKGNNFVYALPELQKAAIKASIRIANPGCFATAIQLALLPLAANKALKNDIHINALTGSTGAGQQPTETAHFSWRLNNVSIYKPFSHQHLDEIVQSLTQLQPDFKSEINFLPVRGNFARGIYASLYTKFEGSIETAYEWYHTFYKDSAFTIVTTENPNLKQVVNTNKCIIHLSKHGDKLLIISMIDNLLKGASGQAVQNMNLVLGLPEKMGLGLKAVYF